MKRPVFFTAYWVVVLAVTMAFIVGSLFRGELNQDEGWYLYAARLVSQGSLPYVDFASTQAPVLPFVYSLGQPLVRHWGLAGGRAFTAAIALLGLFAAGGLAAVLTPGRRRWLAASLAVCLVGVNVYQCYFTTIVKTYSLAGLWLLLGFLSLGAVVRLKRAWPALAAGVFLALAAGTRVSAGVGMAAVFLVLLATGIRHPGAAAPWRPAAGLFVLGAGVATMAIFLPFAIRAPEGVWFALYEYHAGRTTGGFLSSLIYKAGFISRVTHAYFAALALLLFTILGRLAGGGVSGKGEGGTRPDAMGTFLAGGSPSWSDGMKPLLVAAWLTIGGGTLLHFFTPFPYDDYQVMLFPLFGALLGAVVGRWGGIWGGAEILDGVGAPGRVPAVREMAILTLVFLLCAGSAGSSPMLQDWFVGRRDRIWWPMKNATPLATLRQAAERLKTGFNLREGDLLLTQDPYLAVEAGLRIPRGLELGPFSYFPDWSTEQARARNVVNREMMLGILSGAEAGVAAFSGYGLAIRCPGVDRLEPEEEQTLWNVLERRYEEAASIPEFGQAGTTLRIFKRKE